MSHFVFTKKTALMQRLADLVRSGHRLYVSGVVPLERAEALADKMQARYRTDRTKLQASRARAAGEASARLLLWHDEAHPERLTWFLVYCPGAAGPDKSEKWRDALDGKTRIELTGYELVRITKAEAKAPVWTWRYQRERIEELREAARRAIRTHRDDALRQIIHTAWRTPGFAGAREQVKRLGELIRAEWKRSSRGDGMPEIPAHLGYVRRLADKGVDLATLKRRQQQAAAILAASDVDQAR